MTTPPGDPTTPANPSQPPVPPQPLPPTPTQPPAKPTTTTTKKPRQRKRADTQEKHQKQQRQEHEQQPGAVQHHPQHPTVLVQRKSHCKHSGKKKILIFNSFRSSVLSSRRSSACIPAVSYATLYDEPLLSNEYRIFSSPPASATTPSAR